MKYKLNLTQFVNPTGEFAIKDEMEKFLKADNIEVRRDSGKAFLYINSDLNIEQQAKIILKVRDSSLPEDAGLTLILYQPTFADIYTFPTKDQADEFTAIMNKEYSNILFLNENGTISCDLDYVNDKRLSILKDMAREFFEGKDVIDKYSPSHKVLRPATTNKATISK